jgi:hypothetical protein
VMTRDGDDGEADVTAETMMPAAIMVEFDRAPHIRARTSRCLSRRTLTDTATTSCQRCHCVRLVFGATLLQGQNKEAKAQVSAVDNIILSMPPNVSQASMVLTLTDTLDE